MCSSIRFFKLCNANVSFLGVRRAFNKVDIFHDRHYRFILCFSQGCSPTSLKLRRTFCIALRCLWLSRATQNGGGGIRTPVPRCFKTSLYMLSRFIFAKGGFRLTERQTTGYRLSYSGIDLIPQARKTVGSSLLSDALTRPTGKIRQDGPPN